MPTETTLVQLEDDDGVSDLRDMLLANDRREDGVPVRSFDDGEDDVTLGDFASGMGIVQERTVPDLSKPWMKHHDFIRVKTIEEVRSLIDAAIASGHCALDLETEGLDNRIFYDEANKPYTKHKIVGFCLAYGKAKAGYYIPIRHTATGEDLNVQPIAEVEAEIARLCRAAQPTPKEGAKDLLAFKEFEKPPQIIIDFWNAAFDQEFLYPITGIDFWHPDSFEDGNLAAFVKYSGDKSLGLKGKSSEMLRDPEGHPYEMIELKELFPIRGQKIEFHLLSPDEPGVTRYGCSDGICTRLLCAHPELVPLVKAKFGFTYRLEKQVAQVKRQMERYRVRINRARIIELKEKHEKAREEIKAKIVDFAASKGFHGFEPGSPKQLSDFLFGKDPGLDITLSEQNADFPNGKPPMNEKSKQYKTGAEQLDELTKLLGEDAPPVLKWIVEFREEDKILGTYLYSLAENPDINEELRFQFKQTGAATGRFSAPSGDNDQGYSGVPIHGIPATSDLRTCFVARDGYTMVKCDYAGEELRIVTNLSNEKVWIREFLEGTGDLHSITARAFFGKTDVSKDERKMGKIANFALVYGGGPAAVMRATGCDRLEGQRRKQAFDKAVPDFAKWVRVQHAKVKKDLGVWTAFGRWIAIPDANSVDNAIRAACERHATNYPIQGSGADIMKIAMVLIHKELYRRGWLADDSVRMLLTVHDELVFEIKHARVVEAVPMIVERMEVTGRMVDRKHSPEWPVPLVTEPLVGPTWGTGYPCEKAKEGHEAKEGEVIVNGFVYGVIRTVDLGKETPGAGEFEYARDEKAKKVKIRITDPQWLVGISSDVVMEARPPIEVKKEAPSGGNGEAPSAPLTPSVPTTREAVRLAQEAPKNGALRTVTIKLKLLTQSSIEQVRMLCARYFDPDHGALLHLIDPLTNQTLIDTKLGVKVNAEKFASALYELNLSDGKLLLS